MPPGRSGARPLPTSRDHPFDPPRELRRRLPLHPLAFPDGHVGWLVTGYATARAVLADPRFSARQELRHLPVQVRPLATARPTPAAPGMFMRMDPPEHTRYRQQLTGRFTVRRVRQLTPRIRQLANQHLDAMRRHGPPADLVHAYALPIPSLVIAELLGVPHADRERFQHHASVLLGLHSTPRQAEAATVAVTRLLGSLVAAKRAAPDGTLLGDLARDGRLTDRELVGIAMVLLVAGQDTAASMLALGTFALLQHPDQLAALRGDPARIEHAVEELLRYLSIIQFGVHRTALEDVRLDGQQVMAGQTVVISIPAANRDPERFANPDMLDIARPATGHLAFGHGVHQCLGQQLARVQLQIGYAALFDRLPGLRLAVPSQEVPLRTDTGVYGVRRLPVTWRNTTDEARGGPGALLRRRDVRAGRPDSVRPGP